MDHDDFKTNQTAARYLADDLDERTAEAFEEHMMGCRACTEDVEVWRAIKQNVPGRRPAAQPARTRHVAPFLDWRMAASLVGVSVLGAAGGWLGKGTPQGPDIDSPQTVVFNLPAATRGGDECTVLRLGADTKVAVLRVPGVQSGLVIAALDADRHPLPAGQYAVRAQPDGSYLVRIDPKVLAGLVYLQSHRGDGTGGEPLGCITGEVGPRAHLTAGDATLGQER
jgi:hypothetical protein